MSKSKNYHRYDFDDASGDEELIYDKVKTNKFKDRERDRLGKLKDTWDNDNNNETYRKSHI